VSEEQQKDEAQRTRRMGLPPVPGRPGPPVRADQPTDQLPPPEEPRHRTQTWGDHHPLLPRVVPRERRSRARYVVPTLVLLVTVAAVVVALAYRR
jgi:hypothetical protein